MTVCINCGTECFCPVHIEQYTNEEVIETWFCSESCAKQYLEKQK